LNEAAPAGLHVDTKSLQVLTTSRTEFAAASRSRDYIPARRRQLTRMGRQTLNEAAPARLNTDTKSLHVLTTSRAEFAAALADRRTVGLRNSRKRSKKHCYAE
jgi:hypothetical protein